jgi:hypothetical protein
MKRYSIRTLAALTVAGAGMLMGTGAAFAKAPPTLSGKWGKYNLVRGHVKQNSKTNISFVFQSKDTKHGGNGDPLKNQ